MKKIFVFIVLFIVPFITLAQTATTTDGSSDSQAERRERIRGYRRQSSETEQKINSLPTTAVTSVTVPILFGVGIGDFYPNFGDPRGGGTRTHEGEDIMAIKGTPIVSPTPAVVLRVGSGSTEGYYVYTANPGGETFVYMHLDKIGEGVVSGAVLETGSLIGYVGNTGNASGGAAHLHFEIHDSNRDPVDPFPRLTREFTPQEKINFLSKILTITSDATSLSSFIANNFKNTLQSYVNSGVSLPESISSLLSLSPSSVSVQRSVDLPPLDLDIGSRGAEVLNLQKFLILKAVGAEAKKLSLAGATGYFGELTQKALAEYQVAMNISPANGYYGPKTRSSVASDVTSVAQSSPTVSTSLSFNRNLYFGVTGEDVKSLQKFLNSKGFLVARSGVGSVGNETIYFGRATEKALIQYQLANNISPAQGYFGPLTRKTIVGN